ncbi:MAG: energy transducer TonB, partial [Bacteroidota bacterium]
EVHPDDLIPEKEVPKKYQPLVNPQVQASPECGLEEFMNYVRENARYPKSASRICIEGRVIIAFAVEKDGTLSSFESLRPLGYGLDEAVIEAIQSHGGKWKPARIRGEAVSSKMMMPLRFSSSGGWY